MSRDKAKRAPKGPKEKDPKDKGAAEKSAQPPPKPPSFRRERKLFANGVRVVAGCDEAGRGPLAGPVVAAAVILDPNKIPRGIDDSKRLTADERERLFDKICATASFAVAVASPARIDRDNILRASLWALARAVKALAVKPEHVFVDGRDRIAVDCNCEAVIGGDGIVLSIAAASIVAKVTRDRLMARLASECPGYGFESHMGYSVPQHLAALRELGPTVHHRRSFAPVAALLRGDELVEQEAFGFMADEAAAG
jgi:ribonuclease HII